LGDGEDHAADVGHVLQGSRIMRIAACELLRDGMKGLSRDLLEATGYGVYAGRKP
jgi:hypothetical protein